MCQLFGAAFPCKNRALSPASPVKPRQLQAAPSSVSSCQMCRDRKLYCALRWFICRARKIMVHYLTQHVPSLATLRG